MKIDTTTKAELKKYRRAAKNIFKHKNFTETCIRLNGECHQLQNRKPTFASAKLRHALETVLKLEGWREKIWEKLFATVFQKSQLPPTDNPFYKYGLKFSLLENLLHGIGKLQSNDRSAPTIRSVYKPYLAIDKNEQKEAKKFIAVLARVETARSKLPPSKKAQIAEGEAQGAQGIFDDNGGLVFETDATKIYIMLLLCGDYIEQLPSRQKIFRFLKTVMGKEMPHEEEAFMQICKRIGLKGSKGRKLANKEIKGQAMPPVTPP